MGAHLRPVYDTRVVIRRPVAGEAAHLVADLQGGDPLRVEAATARLLVLGPRAVPHLLDAMEAAGAATLPLLRVLELLPATRPAVKSLDRTAALGEAEATAVAAVWASWLAAEDRALATLAFDRLASLALDEAAARPARTLAVRAIGGLGDAASAELLARVPADLAASAAEPSAVTSGAAATLDAPEADAHPGREAAMLREHLAAHGAAAPLSELHRALERARARQRAAATAEEAGDWMAARGAVHQALAQRGSTVALYDLRELLERLESPPPVGAISALRQVGDATCLEAIATAWSRLDDGWTREQLRAAGAEICARHRITPRHAAMKRLATKAPSLAEALQARRRG